MTTRSRGPTLASLWLAVLLLGSGCITQALWEIEPGSSLVVVSEHRVDAAIDLMADPDGDLLLDARHGGRDSLPTARGAASPRTFWQLAPGRGAAEALAALGRTGDFEVERVEVRMRRDVIDGSIDCRADLDLVMRMVSQSWAVAVEPSALPPGVHQAILPIADSDLAFDHTSHVDRVDLLIECARRMRVLDSRLWLPADRDRTARLVGCVWLDGEGRLLADDTRARLTRDFAMDGRPGDHLELLAGLRLLAVVADSEGREFFALQPDLVWILSALDIDAGLVRHSSEWLARPVAPPAGHDLTALGHGTMRLDYFEGRFDRHVGRTLAMKVALSPLTVALDCVLVFPRSWLAHPPTDYDRWERRRHSCTAPNVQFLCTCPLM